MPTIPSHRAAPWLAIAAGLCTGCAGGAARSGSVAPVATDSVVHPDPGAGLSDLLADRLDPEARCLWRAASDLNLDGREDSAFLFSVPGDRVDSRGTPCVWSEIVVMARRSDGSFDPEDAAIANPDPQPSGCRDPEAPQAPRVEVSPGRLSMVHSIAGPDSVSRRLEFAWSDDQATWVLRSATERWKLATRAGGAATWLVHPIVPPPDLTLDQFESASFCRTRCLVEPGWRLMAKSVADLDRDGAPEVVFVSESTDSTQGGNGRFADGTRALSIARIPVAGRLQLVGSSTTAIGGARSGGALGDPFTRLEAGPGWFALEDMSGAASKLSRRQVFRWSKQDGNWLLSEASTQVHLFHEDDSDEPPVVRTPKVFGKIPWTDYDADDFASRFEN